MGDGATNVRHRPSQMSSPSGEASHRLRREPVPPRPQAAQLVGQKPLRAPDSHREIDALSHLDQAVEDGDHLVACFGADAFMQFDVDPLLISQLVNYGVYGPPCSQNVITSPEGCLAEHKVKRALRALLTRDQTITYALLNPPRCSALSPAQASARI